MDTLWIRTATATRTFSQRHSSMLNLLIALDNLDKQKRALSTTASTASTASHEPLFLFTNSKNQLQNQVSADQLDQSEIILKLASQIAKKENALISELLIVQAKLLRAAADQIAVIANDALKLAVSNPATLNSAKDISRLAAMYNKEQRVLTFLIDSLSLAQDEAQSQITLQNVIERWRTLREVDLVWEGMLMETARNAADANAALFQ
ncbi:hypothetical protein BCR33DRAFT_786327 [Rhizoclosmatium globosum]|uniref:Uncharacterized protein n=1 Tax=Rhizoclosmatium globosum TaxID=329046 RepID=A0A1Y2C6T1_9FUNG|nr:hypothetical protein BCR33DRAFT_786327 [Rhizoclosmatium globosum]|eukprot:ORY42607.1 hypothetical protein BCR33DRAFT_786327 [Rhizoclosmatium globosum]